MHDIVDYRTIDSDSTLTPIGLGLRLRAYIDLVRCPAASFLLLDILPNKVMI